jgi:hypothetical protein
VNFKGGEEGPRRATILKSTGFFAGGFLARECFMQFEALVEVIQKGTAAFALLVGGVWILMNYVRNRTHVPRLQVELNAKFIKSRERRYILAMMQVKNPGLSVITFPKPRPRGVGPRGSALLLSSVVNYHEVPHVVECSWDESSAFDILVHHSSIEPGLTIYEEKILQLPDNECDAFWLRLRIAAHGQSWSAETIVTPTPEQSNPDNSLKME